MIRNIVIYLALIILLQDCNLDDNQIGTLGVSQDLPVSKSNHLFRAMYVPDKFRFRLFDSTIVLIDTAWTEANWIHGENGKVNIAEDSGYNMIIPIPQMGTAKMNFDLCLADTANVRYGIPEGGLPDRRQVIRLLMLKDSLKILLEQRNPDTSYGWTRPLFTDTIIFTKIK